jgi:hypothetical protein
MIDSRIVRAGLFVLGVSLTPSDVHGSDESTDGPDVTAEDVMAVLARIPLGESPHAAPGGYERSRDAREIAAAIARNVDGSLLGSRRQDAYLIAIFGSYESALRKRMVGDGGKALGFLQLQYAGPEVAFNPDRAIGFWLATARRSMELCAHNAPEERLAALASGRCDRGRRVVRRRMAVLEAILAPHAQK